MFYIILFILFGLLFLVAEIVLLPGVSIGAILSLGCFGGSVYVAFRDYGIGVGCLVLGVVVVLSLIATVISLRAKTWQRFSLKQELHSTSMPSPEEVLEKGSVAVTVSRLSPMGKIMVNGQIYEAKSQDVYVDPKQEVEVVGFENFTVIVKKL